MSADSGNLLLDTLANLLETEGVGVTGTDIFVHFMPEGVTRGILFLDNYVQRTIDPGIPGYRRGQFRIVVREATYKLGFDLSYLAISSLTMKRRVFSGIEIKALDALHDPIAFPPSANTKAKEFVTNFAATYGFIDDIVS